jgi:RNA polymerase sigma factor (sigma-70 family)
MIASLARSQLTRAITWADQKGDALPVLGSIKAAMMDQDKWGGLMAAAQAGHGGAYRRLLEEVRLWLQRYLSRRLPPSLVEDAVQEAIIAIHNKRHTYDPSRPFQAWFAAIARYKWIDALRMMRHEFTNVVSEDLEIAGDHESDAMNVVLLEQLMATLKPAQADVIRLVKIQGYSIEEASIRTRQSISLVKVNIHRGLARLSKIVQRQADVE